MPSTGYITTRKFTAQTTAGPFEGPNVDYINSATDIEVEKIADGAEPNAGTILTKVDSDPGDTEYTLDSSKSLPEVLLGKALDAGDVLKIRRKTTRGSREVDFVQGATLTEADLDKATKQGIYLAEESLDAAKDANDLYNSMASTYTAGTMPETASENDFLVSSGSVYVSESPENARTALGLGTAAEVDTGTTATSTIPLNTSSAALGTAAYVNTGIGASEAPLNTDLGTASLLDTGTADGTIPVLTTGGALAAGISGVNLSNVKQAPRITIRHSYVADGSSNTSGSAHKLEGAFDKFKWYDHPLTDIIVHRVNKESDSLGITLEGGNLGGYGDYIQFTEEGTYLVTTNSQFFRSHMTVVTRLVDVTGTDLAEDNPNSSLSPAIQGTTVHTLNNSQTVLSTGSGVLNITGNGSTVSGTRPLNGDGERFFKLQWAMDADKTLDNFDNLLGESFQDQIVGTVDEGIYTSGSVWVRNVFAWIDIVKISNEG